MSTQVRPSSASQRHPNLSQPASSGKKSTNNSLHHHSNIQNSQQKTYANSPHAAKAQQNSAQNTVKRHQKQELLVMTIDLGDGTKDLLKVFEGEDPFVLASEFCEKHGLNPQLIEPLAQNIYGNMEQVLQESVQTLDMYGPGSQTEPAEDISESRENNGDTANYRHVEEEEQVKKSGFSEKKGQMNQNQYQEQLLRQQQAQHGHQGIRYEQQENREEEEEHDEEYQTEGHDDYREEKYNSQNYYQGETEERANDSRKYEEEPEMYEMVETDENSGTPGDRMMGSKGSPMGHGLTEKDLRSSKESREVFKKQQVQTRSLKNQIERKVNSAMIPGSEMEKRKANAEYPMTDKFGRSYTSGGEFQNEEEYLDYLITSQYGNGKEKQPSGR